MKANIKDKTLLFLVLCFISIHINAQKKANKEFLYNFLDDFIEKNIVPNNKEHKDNHFWFVEIYMIEECGRNASFAFNSVYILASEELKQRYQAYDYKGTLIVYRTDPKKKSEKFDFFDKYLEKINYNFSYLPQEGNENGYQSIVIGYGLFYYKKKFYTKSPEILDLIEKNCAKGNK